MMSHTQRTRRSKTVFATVTAITALAAAVFAPAGFGRSLSTAALWEDRPVVCVPPVAVPGQNFNCAVAFEAQPVTSDPFGASAGVNTPESDTKNVTVYSDPPGAVTYNGTVSGSNIVIPAHVAADAAPGTVTIFIQTDGSAPATATTTVTGG